MASSQAWCALLEARSELFRPLSSYCGNCGMAQFSALWRNFLRYGAILALERDLSRHNGLLAGVVCSAATWRVRRARHITKSQRRAGQRRVQGLGGRRQWNPRWLSAHPGGSEHPSRGGALRQTDQLCRHKAMGTIVQALHPTCIALCRSRQLRPTDYSPSRRRLLSLPQLLQQRQ